MLEKIYSKGSEFKQKQQQHEFNSFECFLISCAKGYLKFNQSYVKKAVNMRSTSGRFECYPVIVFYDTGHRDQEKVW